MILNFLLYKLRRSSRWSFFWKKKWIKRIWRIYIWYKNFYVSDEENRKIFVRYKIKKVSHVTWHSVSSFDQDYLVFRLDYLDWRLSIERDWKSIVLYEKESDAYVRKMKSEFPVSHVLNSIEKLIDRKLIFNARRWLFFFSYV